MPFSKKFVTFSLWQYCFLFVHKDKIYMTLIEKYTLYCRFACKQLLNQYKYKKRCLQVGLRVHTSFGTQDSNMVESPAELNTFPHH